MAEQAPTGGNDASRRWLVIRDQDLKNQLGELYAEVGTLFRKCYGRLDGTGHPKEQVVSSSAYLVENFANVPVLVMCAIWGIHDNSGRPGLFDSAIPSAWSFNLALRSRGLGTAYATMLNNKSDEVSELLGIPKGVTTLVCFPVAHTIGHDFFLQLPEGQPHKLPTLTSGALLGNLLAQMGLRESRMDPESSPKSIRMLDRSKSGRLFLISTCQLNFLMSSQVLNG